MQFIHIETELDISTRINHFGQLLIPMLGNTKNLVISHEGFLYKLCNQRVNLHQSIDFYFDTTKQTKIHNLNRHCPHTKFINSFTK
jgi:hypothetical protein